MKPTIGRIVHFKAEGLDIPVAAIIVRVWSDTCVNLRLFCDGSNGPNRIPFGEWFTSSLFDNSETPQVNTWNWPPKV